VIDPAHALATGNLLAIPAVLLGGLIAGMNPCCLAMYPAAAASCCATCNTTQAPTRNALYHSLVFIFGAAVATSLLGMGAALLGRVMGQFGSPFRYAVAAIPLLMGLHLLGWVRLPLHTIPVKVLQPGLVSAFATGFLLSLALSPCGTPVLAAVLSYVALKGSIVFGALLLFIYGIGAGVPVVILGTISGGFANRLTALGRQHWVDRISGLVLIAMGLYLLWLA
jgi:cytochrome c biogenesis protein CcdA